MLIEKWFRKISYVQYYINTLSEIAQHIYIYIYIKRLCNICGALKYDISQKRKKGIHVNNINTNQLIEEWKKY